MSQRVGIIYPLLPKHIQRILNGKNIFCKFIGRGSKIVVGQKLLFYSSRGNRKITGEATIRKLEYLTPEELLRKYGKNLFITPKELKLYAVRRNRSSNGKLLVMVLSNMQEYEQHYQLERSVAMSGLILTDTFYEKIVSSAKTKRGPC